MRVLLTDGSGLTSKQTSYCLGTAGHHVEAMAPSGLSLARCTRYVRRVHPVAPYGRDPLAWLDAAMAIWATGAFDVLLPTQEQVAVLSLAESRLLRAKVVTVVPPFEALLAVQDKVSAFRTLSRLGIPQPEGTVVESAEELTGYPRLPIFVKLPVGTASSGVHLVKTRPALALLATSLHDQGVFARGGVLVQAPVVGPLVMVQSVFDRGALVAFHACQRTREGVNGGASHKRSVPLPSTRGDIERMGTELAWHGALSADVIVGEDGPMVIDVNPRLVEPVNAQRSGTDLVGSLLRIAAGVPEPGRATPTGDRSGVCTHQLLLAVLGAASDGGRRAVAAELLAAARHRGLYRDSHEELSPVRHDPMAILPVAAAVLATLCKPPLYSWFTEGSVTSYALTPEGWQAILDVASRTGT